MVTFDLAGTRSEADIRLPGAAELDADRRLTTEVTGLSVRERALRLGGGAWLSFDGLDIPSAQRSDPARDTQFPSP